MEITVEKANDVAVVAMPVAELDAANTAEFKRDMAPVLDAHAKVVLDLTRLRFIDSSGLGVLVSGYKNAATHQGSIKLCSLQTQVKSMFELTRLHRVFDIYQTMDEALESY